MEKYKVSLSKDKNLSMFVDELSQIVDNIEQLPYGILSLVLGCIEDKIILPESRIKTEDWEDLRAYYMMAAIFMTKKDKNLIFSEEDVDRFCKLIFELKATIAIMESVFDENIRAVFDKNSGEWVYHSIEKEKLKSSTL